MTDAVGGTRSKPALSKVMLPTEHGGWSLTLEPVILGLIVAPSRAGALLGAVALLGFLVRTPLKVSLGDRHRNRRLQRTVLADKAVAVEITVLAAVLASAALSASTAFWAPLLLAAPLFTIELWFDVRSKSRYLLPELAGTIGIGAIASAIALAGGTAGSVAWGLWAIAAARAVAAIPFVRVQLRRAKAQRYRLIDSDGAQGLAVAGIIATTAGGATTAIAAGAIAALAAIHLVQVRLAPPRAPVLGAQQVVLGLAVVVTAGLAAAAP
ncbi:MAG TPA: YwiC-like family protein [Acidimicrobiia bacterium]|nr:YwiC-like family protein [Acidimicrobiia bacterium]